MTMTPFGVPVEPDVYWRKAGEWESGEWEVEGFRRIGISPVSVGLERLLVAIQATSELRGGVSQLVMSVRFFWVVRARVGWLSVAIDWRRVRLWLRRGG